MFRKILLYIFIAALAPVSVFGAETLYKHYIDNRGSFPSFEKRAQEAAQCGVVGNSDNYQGTREQNLSLLSCLKDSETSSSPKQRRLGGTVTKPYDFSPNTVIRSSEVNSNFDTLYNLVNGNIDNANIDASADIDRTKILGTGIVNSPSARKQTIKSNLDITGTSTFQGGFTAEATSTVTGTLFVTSTDGYFAVNRVPTANRTSFNARNGAIVYDTDDGQFYVKEGGGWAGITAASTINDASKSGKGVTEIATGKEAASTTAIGGGDTSAPLALDSSIATSSRQTTGHFVPITQSDGTLDSSFGGTSNGIATTNGDNEVVQDPASATSTPVSGSVVKYDSNGNISELHYFGDGSDGDVTIADGTTTTLQRDMHYQDLTVNGAIKPNGYKIFATGTVSGTGKIVSNGGDGGDGGQSSGGSAGTISSSGTLPNGVNGSSGDDYDSCGSSAGSSKDNTILTVNGADGGSSESCSSPSGGTSNSTSEKFRVPEDINDFYSVFNSTVTLFNISGQAAGGAPGGTSGSCSGNPGGGGGGGASGGFIAIYANHFDGSSLTIESIGGNGGDGGDSTADNCGGGGGAGGNGGVVFIIYQAKTSINTNLSGGVGGSGGSAGIANGSGGSNGNSGKLIEIQI